MAQLESWKGVDPSLYVPCIPIDIRHLCSKRVPEYLGVVGNLITSNHQKEVRKALLYVYSCNMSFNTVEKPTPERPRFVFFFTGPTACGKSTVAKYVADQLNLSFLEGDDVRRNSSLMPGIYMPRNKFKKTQR